MLKLLTALRTVPKTSNFGHLVDEAGEVENCSKMLAEVSTWK